MCPGGVRGGGDITCFRHTGAEAAAERRGCCFQRESRGFKASCLKTEILKIQLYKRRNQTRPRPRSPPGSSCSGCTAHRAGPHLQGPLKNSRAMPLPDPLPNPIPPPAHNKNTTRILSWPANGLRHEMRIGIPLPQANRRSCSFKPNFFVSLLLSSSPARWGPLDLGS